MVQPVVRAITERTVPSEAAAEAAEAAQEAMVPQPAASQATAETAALVPSLFSTGRDA
jgi:hypothetical protein